MKVDWTPPPSYPNQRGDKFNEKTVLTDSVGGIVAFFARRFLEC